MKTQKLTNGTSYSPISHAAIMLNVNGIQRAFFAGMFGNLWTWKCSGNWTGTGTTLGCIPFLSDA